jgi:hypothetical protein
VALAVLTCVGLMPATGHAQVLYGSIVGHVVDSSGAALPGATVTVTSKETNLTRTTVTNETGQYTLTNVPAGTYEVKVSLQGFREYVQADLPVSVNTVSRADVRLELGALSETITVESQSSLLQTDKADLHTELKSEAITNLPLSNYRNYQTLINLVPGATPATFQNSEVDTPGRSLRTFVNGQNPNNNGTKTDGATNVNLWLPHHNMYVSPAETVDTVNVSTNNFDAEQGMAGGAAITVVTKSGTNEFKGSAFEYFNNDGLNARPYFQASKTPSSAHIAGATLGGPIAHDRLFFFGSWEGQFQRSTATAFYNVPPAALRNGDFSQAFNADGSLQIIYDPATGNPDGTGRTPFAGNVIPQDRIDDIARKIQDLFPDPNAAGSSGANVGGASVTRNFTRDNRRVFDRNNYDFKVNWNRTSTQQIWGKYSRMGADVSSLFKLGYDGGGKGETTVQQATFGTTWTLSPTMVFDATYGASWMDQTVAGDDFTLGQFGRDTLGIPGTNGGTTYPNDPRYAGMPAFLTGFSTLGNDDTWNPLFRDERTYNLSGNLTKLHGKHELRFGYSVNRLAMDHWQPELGQGPRGIIPFNGDVTNLRGGTQSANLYNQYAAFLLGLIAPTSTGFGKGIQYEEMTAREWQHGLYARDRWTLNSKMTLDLGLRYEYYPLMTRKDRGIESMDLDTLEVLLGGLGGNPKDLGIKVSKTLFAPRLGFVYRINEDTVFRSGYGLTYNPLPFSRPLRGFYPLTISGTFVPLDSFGWASTLEQGIPEITGPDLSSGRIPLPNQYDMRFPENDVSRGHIHSWNVAIERRLPMDISVDLAYVGTAGRDGFADLDINASDTPGGGVASRPFFNEFGRRIALNSWGPRTRTNYDALQVAINRPFKNGLLLKGAYTYSKSMNETDEDGWAALSWNGASQLDRNYALAGYDRPHIFQMAFVYELPYHVSSAQNKVLGAVLGDWQVNGIYSAFSGTPFTISANGGVLDMPGNLQTADQVGDYKELGGKGSDGLFFDKEAFAQPEGVRFGNTGRNAFRGPGQWNLDFSLFRGFALGGSRRAEFRAEFFNLTNTPKWRNPLGSNSTTDIAGTINVNDANFGRNFNVAGERQIRLGVRFSF